MLLETTHDLLSQTPFRGAGPRHLFMPYSLSLDLGPFTYAVFYFTPYHHPQYPSP